MTHRDKHPFNVKIVEVFMVSNKGKAYNREEVARATGVSKGAVKGILHVMYKAGVVERHFVKMRDGDMKTYYNWKRCAHLAGDDCVVRETACSEGKACCLKCRLVETCNVRCELADAKYKKTETIIEETIPVATPVEPVQPTA